MFDVSNLESIETLESGDLLIVLRKDGSGIADVLQYDISKITSPDPTTSIWEFGPYSPSINDTPSPNSFYLKTTTGDIFTTLTTTVNGVTTTTWNQTAIMTLTGPKGDDGKDGESAYQLAVDGGYTGTQSQWLASLAGPSGADGTRTYFVYSVPTGIISDGRGNCRPGDYAIVTLNGTDTSGDTSDIGETYVYQGGGKWSGPITISLATTGPIGPPPTLENSDSISVTEISTGVYELSLNEKFFNLDASSNINQIIDQGSNNLAYGIKNANSEVFLGVTSPTGINDLTLSSSGKTTFTVKDTSGSSVILSPDGSSFDNGKIISDGSGNLTVNSLTLSSGQIISETDSDNRYLRLDGSNSVNSKSFNILKDTNLVGIELGLDTNVSYIDFHSCNGNSNDYDSRIVSSGGTSGSIGSGSLSIIANSLLLTSPSTTLSGSLSFDDGKIFSDGSGNLTVSDGYSITCSNVSNSDINAYSLGQNTTAPSQKLFTIASEIQDGMKSDVIFTVTTSGVLCVQQEQSYYSTSGKSISQQTLGFQGITGTIDGISQVIQVVESPTQYGVGLSNASKNGTNIEQDTSTLIVNTSGLSFNVNNSTTTSSSQVTKTASFVANTTQLMYQTGSCLLNVSNNGASLFLSTSGVRISTTAASVIINNSTVVSVNTDTLTATNVASSNYYISSVSENLSAYADATSVVEFSSRINVITDASNGTYVKLPSVDIGIDIRVINRSSETINLLPNTSTEMIESLTAGTAQSIISGGSAHFIKTSATQWRIL